MLEIIFKSYWLPIIQELSNILLISRKLIQPDISIIVSRKIYLHLQLMTKTFLYSNQSCIKSDYLAIFKVAITATRFYFNTNQ